MDDLAHESRPPIHSLSRKRKADPDDQHPSPAANNDPAAPNDPMLLDVNVQATPRCPAPEPSPPSTAPWPVARASQGTSPTWPSSSSPAAFLPQRNCEGQAATKRLRIDIPCTPPASPSRGARRPTHRPPPPRHASARHRRGDQTAVSPVDREASLAVANRKPLTRTASLPSLPSQTRPRPVSPIEQAISPHVPPHTPPINRDTLKELDLEAILRNPQLRHDLLFDSGLQFRPTSSRRKRDLADNYWLAIVRELECGCTCTTLDAHGRPAEHRCACAIFPRPPPLPCLAFSTGNLMTVRAPSRILPLLHELVEVLVSIIQPPPAPRNRPAEVWYPQAAPATATTAAHPQLTQSLAHVALLRSLLDPALIQQEIDHGLFDPSGVFRAIGDVIRCHCAPMRDAMVDSMVAWAAGCAPGGSGTKLDAVRAIRLCFEIMELMKLDVANHQLQTLRPYLVRTSAQYEMRTFHESRQPHPPSLQYSRLWLRATYDELASGASPLSARFLRHGPQTKVTIAVVKAIVGLLFDPPPPATAQPDPESKPASSQHVPSASSSAASSAASTPTVTPAVASAPLPSSSGASPSSSRPRVSSSTTYAYFPETLFLDYGRLTTLGTDAADFTGLYMLLMLFRQLVHSRAHQQSRAAGPSTAPAVETDDLVRLKKEIWEIGPAHPGLCFMQHRPRSSGSSGRAPSSSRHDRDRDRESELRKWREDTSNVVLHVTMRAGEPRPADGEERVPRAPDAAVLAVANSWAESHLRAGSPLSTLMKKRVRECVEELVLNVVCPPPAAAVRSHAPSTPSKPEAPTSNGLEPLMPELRHLAERTAKLVQIHVNVYGALYAHPGFLDAHAPAYSDADALAAATRAAAAALTTATPGVVP
ncbi:Tcp11-domain-containing protein [Epithele typhae]|uniref:Tcp11-domain-containing protein n=1 Tax=Epithele typhae TaxID=378194 RepID=UPI0020085C01|nr:Tcp11-domain-containing protein [Epithele typhae]KAH9922792.1 Tcp11-domain-containing protein [Epithele typhae]